MYSYPLVSYVLTAYNCEHFIRSAIQSALNQTYSPLEIVLSDDCSTDATFDIMKEMAESYSGPHKIILNRNEVNLGITKHMNKAYLELATGEYIVAAHGDDVSIPERTSLSMKYLLSNPDITAVSGGLRAVIVNQDGSEVYAANHSAIVQTTHTYDFNSLANIPAPSRCFKRSVMTTFGPLQDWCPTEDELITFRALMLGKNVFLPDIMVTYRKHRHSNSNPDQFHRFPLEKILEQQTIDMAQGVKMGLITDDVKLSIETRLKSNMLIRKDYRKYFRQRSFSTLFHLLLNPHLTLRRRAAYLKEHINYLRRKYEW